MTSLPLIAMKKKQITKDRSCFQSCVEMGFKSLVLSLIFALVATQDYLTCLRNDDPARLQQGKPGKRGASGPKGSRGQAGSKGAKGDRGPPDNSRINSLQSNT